jgi:hypothetical protein
MVMDEIIKRIAEDSGMSKTMVYADDIITWECTERMLEAKFQSCSSV